MAEPAAKMYTPPEVAEMVGCKEHTLRSWIRSGLITPTEIAGKAGTPQARYFFDADAVEAVRKIHEEGGRAEAAKLAMQYIPEEILAQLETAKEHFMLDGEMICISARGIYRIDAKASVSEMRDLLGPGPFMRVK